MQETAQDLEQLQAILTSSIERAGQFLKSSFQMPEHSLNAEQIAKHLQGQVTLSFATVSKNAAPRVAPIAALFYRGQFYIPTVLEAARSKMLEQNPQISLTYYQGNDFAIIVHGQADFVRQDNDLFTELEQLHRRYNKGSLLDWSGEGVFIHVLPDVIYTFARYIEHF